MNVRRYMLGLACVVCIAGGTGMTGSCGQRMSIVINGQANAAIVVDKDAPEMVRFAASQLQTYIEKQTGVKLTVVNEKPASGNVIYVGESRYTRELGLSLEGLRTDGFKIITGDGWMAMFGKESEPVYFNMHPFHQWSSYSPANSMSKFGETGALYAVYYFLEKQCGIYFCMPGDLGEVVPKSKNLSVGRISIARSPDIPYRHVYYTEFQYGADETLWYRRAGFGGRAPVGIMHSFVLLKKYAKEHPEYFSIIDGERDIDKTSLGDGSLCLSNPGTLEAFVREANQFFEQNPDLEVFPVMPNDGWDRMCECPECQKWVDSSAGVTGKFSEYVWDFVNRVAKEVAKSHPDKLIGCCAYSHYLDPPKKIDKLSPNVAVMTCKMRLNYWDKSYQKKINSAIDTWRRKTPNVYIWEYYIYACGYDLSKRGLPIFFPTIIGEDMRFLKNRIQGEFVEAESWITQTTEPPIMRNKALISPILYLTGKLYWDTSLDPQKLMDEYCRVFYGPAAKDLRAFWGESEQLWMGKGPDDQKQHALVYTPEAVNALTKHLYEGLVKTGFDSIEGKRIRALIGDVKPTFERINNPLLKNRPKLMVPFTASAPVLDGVLNDACWEQGVKIEFSDAFGAKPKYPSTGYLAWDNQNLYIAFSNKDPHPEGILINCTAADAYGIWDDEVNELFFRPGNAPTEDYYQFIINAGGHIWDAHFHKNENNPTRWESGAKAKAAIGQDGWTLEAAIPLSSIGLSEGKTLTTNFYRSRNNKDIVGATRSCWSPNISDANYVPERFGYLTLKK